MLGAEERVTKRRTNSPTIDDGHGVGKVPAQRKAVGRKVTKPKTYPGRELEAELWEKGHRLVAGAPVYPTAHLIWQYAYLAPSR